MVVEEDDVGWVKFFGLCKEVVEGYEKDRGMWMIWGIKQEEIRGEMGYEYLLRRGFWIWGWVRWGGRGV